MKYLKYFEESSAYETYKNGSDYVLPNVSYIKTGEVLYNSFNKNIICTYIIDDTTVNTPVKIIHNANVLDYDNNNYNIIIDGAKTTWDENDPSFDENLSWTDGGADYMYTFSSTGIHTVEFVPLIELYDSSSCFYTGTDGDGGMFEDCPSLYSVQIPNMADWIDIHNCLFLNCEGLKEVIFPKNTKSLGNSVFENCSNNPTVILNATNPPLITKDTFFTGDIFSGMTIKVPFNSDYSEWQNNNTAYYPGYYPSIKFETI